MARSIVPHPFAAVETLLVGRRLTKHVSLALEDVMEVLPCLHALYLKDRPATYIERFTAVHWRSDPVTVTILAPEENVLTLA